MEKLDAVALKQRDELIWQKYTHNVDENNLEAVYLQGAFLGILEQLVRILHRNTGNISRDFKDCNFFKLALITYVDLYCKILVQPEFAEGAKDVAHIAISEYYNKDYEVIATLPQVPIVSNETACGSWVRYMRYQFLCFGIRNLALLDVMNSYYFHLTGELNHFLPAVEHKISFV